MNQVEFKHFAFCDTCGVEMLCRKTESDEDECGHCYWAPINHAKHQSELEELRKELKQLENFVGYLLDHCEGQTIYEESLQYWLSESIKLNKSEELGGDK